MTTRVVTFGEIMQRLKAPGHVRFFHSPAFEATFDGGGGFGASGSGNNICGRRIRASTVFILRDLW
jgi:hypothetical protein